MPIFHLSNFLFAVYMTCKKSSSIKIPHDLQDLYSTCMTNIFCFAAKLKEDNKSLSQFSYDSTIEAPLIFDYIISNTFVGLTVLGLYNIESCLSLPI